ncbi:hypothetical protein N8K70_11350 [Microbacterium betulae]|uniref:Replicase polyprotein 1ab n=1 Tax=Microbacterium betulae TaxID=2981139 RepID=A0AA97I4P3_9MICO|nr:hypothetical protein [Microbacterium sp. AB]WOF21974.1 hypothetical protein N8K70_11350 [Microbacterium sp. AB]
MRIPDPELPDDITPSDLPSSARNELKTLSKENAERVARHMAMAVRLIDEDPDLAHEHALAAVRHAGRIGIARETLAVTAYSKGDFALALRELRTHRRITGRNDNVALIVDSERGVGRPEKALEEGRSADRSVLDTATRVELAIAMSGARLDLGQTELALHELDIPELDPDRAFEWSPGLFGARANVLEDLGRSEEAASWRRRAEIAEEALGLNDQADADDYVFVDDTDTELLVEEGAQPGQDEEDASSEPVEPDDAPDDAEEPTRSADVSEAASDVVETSGDASGIADAIDAADAEEAERTEDDSDDEDVQSAAGDAPDADTDAVVPEQPSDHGDDTFTIEDEVTEILVAAGIEGAEDVVLGSDDAADEETPDADTAPDDVDPAGAPADGADDARGPEEDKPDGALF